MHISHPAKSKPNVRPWNNISKSYSFKYRLTTPVWLLVFTWVILLLWIQFFCIEYENVSITHLFITFGGESVVLAYVTEQHRAEVSTADGGRSEELITLKRTKQCEWMSSFHSYTYTKLSQTPHNEPLNPACIVCRTCDFRDNESETERPSVFLWCLFFSNGAGEVRGIMQRDCCSPWL